MNAKRILLVVGIISALVFPISGQTAVTLTVTPLTWNIIGLDSNKPTTGPKNFPVGARVCSAVATTNVTVDLVWDSANANINLRPGSLSSLSIASIAAGTCADAYFEVEVTQVAAAYDTTRRYHITATDGSGTASTPTPRELYVEHLVSQSRNGITDIKLNGVSIPAAGSMNLVVGNTYTIELDGFTATQGYNQLESFINFPNTIFQILSVTTTYSADSNTTNVPNPSDKLYANACVWENDLSSPNYRSCVGGDDKAGGTVVTTYTVNIISGGGTSQILSTLLYDFSGSSFHYNSDLSASARIANIADPASLTIAKAFSPSSTVAGGLSTLTFTITNPTPESVGNVSFSDSLPTSPGAMTVASTPSASTSGCGTATFTALAGATAVSFVNGTLAPNSACTASVSVTVPSSPTSGNYTNTSDHLFVGSLDTGHVAAASLALIPADTGTGLCGLTLARWNFPSGFSTAAPAASTANVTASAAAGAGLNPVASTNSSLGPADGTGSWSSNGSITTGATLVTANNEYFEFALDTTGSASVDLTFDALFKTPNGPTGLAVYYGASNARPESGTQAFLNATAMGTQNTWHPIGAISFTSGLNPSGTTYFRIYSFNSGNTNAGSDVDIDNVLFTGCGAAGDPTISKSFSPNPIAVNSTSALTFTLSNPNTASLTGVKFTDTLPSGLEVAATPAASTTCGGAPSWAPTAGSTTLGFGQTIAATMPASSSCTVSVNVKATTSGPHVNVSGFVSSAEGGTNSGPGGSATTSLTALQPPSIAKLFGPDPILTNGTSTLMFLITNPNPNDSVSGVAFSDIFPTSPGAMTVASTPNASTVGCGAPTFTPVVGAGSIAFANGTISAGATCTVKLDVTAATAGDYVNTSGVVSATIAGVPTNGNTAAETLTVRTANPGIGLLKRVSSSASGPWTTFISVAPGTSIFYQFIIENLGDVPLSSVSVTDPTVSTSSCAWPASLPVASPTQDPTATCVVGPVTGLAGDNPNTATAHGTNGGTVTDSDPSSADYIGAVPGFSLLKQISASAIGPWSSAINGVSGGSSLFYKFTIVNTGNVPLTGVNVTDAQVDASGCTFSDPLNVGGATTCVVGPVIASTTLGPHTNTATAHGTNGGTPSDSAPSSASYTVASSEPDLSIGKTHAGNFSQGQIGATYTVTVTNAGLIATSGTVTVTEAPPAGLTVTGLVGTGWSCDVGTLTCTRSDALAASASHPAITVTVTVSVTAAASVTNVASVSGGGETNTANNSASDPTTINPAVPDLTILKSHSGNFVQGQTGAVYSVTVTNLGPGVTTGLVTVTEAPPAELTVTGLVGTGWSCNVGTLTCTRSDALAASASYPAITATVNVSATAPVTVTNVASVSGGGDTSTGNNSSSDPTTVSPPTPGPDLTILKSHSGNFAQGQTGATYTVTVTNVGGAATTGLVTVTEVPPAELTVTELVGTGWSCNVGTLACTRSDALAASASYPAITVTVNVSATAAASVTNVASVSGGGETNTANNSASDPTTINPAAPDLTILKSHSGNFTQGQTGAVYSVTVTNLGPGVTTGLVTVTEAPPAGLTVTGLAGTGWSCNVGTLTCTRSDALAASASYPAITVTVNVSATAAASVTNVASVSGGGETNTANNSASDPATVNPPSVGPDLTILKSHSGNFTQGQTGAVYTVTVTNVGSAATTGLVTVTDTLPTGLTATAMAGTGWICVLATLTCTRSDALAAGASYPAITLTVNVASDAAGNLVNTASVSGGGDASPVNNTIADGTIVDPPAPIPTLSEWAFMLLAAVLVLTAVRAISRRARQSLMR